MTWIYVSSIALVGLTGATMAKASAVNSLHLDSLESKIEAHAFPKLTAVLVSRKGDLVYEKYFGEGSPEHLNNTRSATKSLTALVVGRAIQDGAIQDTEAKVINFFPDLLPPANDDPIKSDIRLKDLLTMSSALAADDSDHSSPGNEDRMHERPNWTRWGIDLPTRKDYSRNRAGFGPFHYATINAVLLGQVVQRAVHQSVDSYIADALLTPLRISQYKFQTSPTGEIMTGGGLELRAIDLCRLGQLLIDEGQFEGRQIIPASWVRDCLTVRETETGRAGVEYGFLFWHMNFHVGTKIENGWYMAGNGGNMVLILPALKAVIVVTRTAYNLPTAAKETIEIVSNFILPTLEEP